MDTDISQQRATATIIGSAGVFAAAFWLLDSGNVLWTSDSGVFSAILPEGSQFVERVIYAAVFAIAGWIAGTALQRSQTATQLAFDKLEESERKYRALLASSFDSVISLDSNLRIVEASDSAATLLGNTAAGLTGLSIDRFVHVDRDGDLSAATSINHTLEQAIGHQECSLEATVRDQLGRQFPAEIRVTPMTQGHESAFLLAVRESTSTVVAQKALRHSERRYQALFDNIPGGVYRGLPDGRLLAANPALATMLGYDSVDELIEAGNAKNFFMDQHDRNALTTELERSGVARNLEIRLRRRDGEAVTVLANIQAVGHDNRDSIVYEGILTDISELLEARERLLDSEEHFRALCEHSLDVITVIDANGDIEYSSPSSHTLTRRPPADQVGLSLLRNVHPDDIETVTRIISDGFARPGTPHHFTCRIFRDDGSMRYVDSVGTAFVTSKGQLRAVIQSRDVTGVAERPGNTSETSNELAAETRSAGKVGSTDE